MRKSGLADSPLFAVPHKRTGATASPSSSPPARKGRGEKQERAEKQKAIAPPSHHETTPPPNQETTTPRNHDTTVSRYHDATIESVRKAVKGFGKEAATHRFTTEEKKAIADIIYAYKNQGVKTSENEIARIAINFVLDDYRENGKNSVLNRVLEALNE